MQVTIPYTYCMVISEWFSSWWSISVEDANSMPIEPSVIRHTHTQILPGSPKVSKPRIYIKELCNLHKSIKTISGL